MNYENLQDEIDQYTNHIKLEEPALSKFNLFIKEFSKTGNKFIQKSKKLFEDFSLEISKDGVEYTTFNKYITLFSNEFREVLNNLENYFTEIEKNLAEKINEFEKSFKNSNKEYITKLTDLSNLLEDNKSKLDKIKNSYFDSCKNILDLEKKSLETESKILDKDEELMKIEEQIKKAKEVSETKKLNYRIEVTKLNELLASEENYYLDIVNGFQENESKKINFYIEVISSLTNNTKKVYLEGKDSIDKIKNYIDNINVRRDLNFFDIRFNYLTNTKEKTRFIFEEFLDYENLVNKTGNKIDKKNTINDNSKINIDENTMEIGSEKSDYDKAFIISNLGKKSLIDRDTMSNEYLELDNIIFNLLRKDVKLDDDKITRIMDFVDDKKKVDNQENFLFLLMNNYNETDFVVCNCIENLYILRSVLNMIINAISENTELLYLVFIIFFVSEKTIFYKEDSEISQHYLCKIMSTNSLYDSIDFWINVINLKIKMIAEIKVKNELKFRKKNEGGRKDSTAGVFGTIGKFFGGKTEVNENIEKEILYSQIYKDNSSIYCKEALEEFIKHFIDFNFNIDKSIEVVKKLSDQYQLTNNQRKYYLEILHSNKIYSKINNPYFNIEDNDDNKNIDTNKYFLCFNSNKKFKSVKKNSKMKSIFFSMKYLTNKEVISILCLNKNYNLQSKKTIYKNLLMKYNNMDINQHLNIWKIFLDYNSVKKKYNYKKIIETIINDRKSVQLIDIIELDMVRTQFGKNQKENQIKIGNILKAVSKELPTINYCQGMNHIAAFILCLCDENEEEAFYLLISILLMSEYCILVDNDLKQLHSVFHSFERLLDITFPEMYNFLKGNGINAAYFTSPWFITLFTNAFFDNKEKNNYKFMMKIFDIFLFSGWKGIYKIGISLLKNNAKKIMSYPYEKLVTFLNNEVVLSEFFRNENLNELMNIDLNFKISRELMDNIKEEYEILVKEKEKEKN